MRMFLCIGVVIGIFIIHLNGLCFQRGDMLIPSGLTFTDKVGGCTSLSFF